MSLIPSMTASRVSAFVDCQLRCIICKREFIFTADEQQFFFEQGFSHNPKRCKRCMANRRENKSRVRAETQTQCAVCGASTTVPFVPSQGKPVFCHSCFRHRRATSSIATPAS